MNNTEYLLLSANNVNMDIECVRCPDLKTAQQMMEAQYDPGQEDVVESEISDTGAYMLYGSNDMYYWSIIPMPEA